MEIKGKIHSLETFGTVDGPGIRFVVFMQGCPLRCLYCHNPDTWDTKESSKYQLSSSELMTEVQKYKSFIASGGVTVTGGEPLLQAEFLKEFFTLCRSENIHTALDTSGCIYNDRVLEVYKYTDLVLLDIKALDEQLFKTLTGATITSTLKTLDYLQETNIPIWIRHVIVPEYTDGEKQLENLARFLSNYSVIQKVELLPYHVMGISKYEQLNMEYKLKNIKALSPERMEAVKKIFQGYGFSC